MTKNMESKSKLLMTNSPVSLTVYLNQKIVDEGYLAGKTRGGIRKNLYSIPVWLNNAALEKGVNFSQVLQDTLKAQLYLG